MDLTRATVLAVFLAGVAWAQQGQAKQAGTAMEKAIYLEETVGDANGAMELYSQIMADPKASKNDKAKASFKAACWHIKNGEKDQGQKILKELMAQYPDQKLYYQKARAELLKLDVPQAGARPKVIATSPATGSNDVDPSVSKIIVCFDNAMSSGGYSWVGGGDTYPKTTGKPFYDDNKTSCTMPVALEPGKVYWVGINSDKFTNFQSEDRRPAIPYAVVFATRDAQGNATPIPNEMLESAKRINAMSEQQHAQYVPKILGTSPEPFATDVPATLDKLVVKFDREMMGGFSWTGGGETRPESTASPYWDESKKVCTNPVKLEPGKVYWIGINSPSHKNFKSVQGQAVPWYVIVFATASADGSKTPIPAEMIQKAKAINKKASVLMGRKE